MGLGPVRGVKQSLAGSGLKKLPEFFCVCVCVCACVGVNKAGPFQNL